MKKIYTILAVTWFLAGCAEQKPANAKAEPPAAPDRRTESRTDWSAKTELFVEFPELVQGEESRFAIHLTPMDDFKTLAARRSELNVI